MMEAYIELLIAAFISFKMFEIKSIWNSWDHFAVVVHFIGIAAIVAFFIFTCWFVFFRIVPLTRKKKA